MFTLQTTRYVIAAFFTASIGAAATVTALSTQAAAMSERTPVVLAAQPPPALVAAGFPRRLVAIDNVCAWPNITTLRDGSLVAIVFNQPNHGFTEGDVECWASADGRFWKYLSTVTRHAPATVRMNHGVGLNAEGHLVVLCSGWDDIRPRRNPASRTIQTVGAISRDGGTSWEQLGPVMPHVEGLSWHVPFGDIQLAANGDLVAGNYAFTRPRTGNIYVARSKDGGRTWRDFSPIARDRHVEAAVLHVGGGNWLAASRRFESLDLEIFTSDDDALTWRSVRILDAKPVSSAHLLRLSDGRVLLTYGNRTVGDCGIDARTSSDGGRSWTVPQRLVALEKPDCGYPEAVEFAGRCLMVAYYSDGVPAHQRYHMGVVNLTLDELEREAATAPDFTLSLSELLPASVEGGSWFQPRAVAIPMPAGPPRVVMTIQKAVGSDFFSGLSTMRSDDLGKTWTAPREDPGLGWRPLEHESNMGVCDITLGWHAPSRKVIGIGHTVRYTQKGFGGIGDKRETAWITYDPETDRWSPWKTLTFPEHADGRYYINAVHGQWLVEPDGTLLVPFYALGPNVADAKWKFAFRGGVARMTFTNGVLEFGEAGREMTHPVPRGLYEKSIVRFRGRYFLTIRNDQTGYVAVSDDGLNFGPIKAWTFDDGSELGSYNTHQKWVVHSDGLFLVYTRRGANNDHIPRHRAPLFIARVDPETLCVIRSSERIAVPERGVDIGNFDATAITEDETWITVASTVKSGPAWLARVRWSKPNELAARGR
uniref:sialidase family protein n=1 Tax=Horticoccus sp. 23ND18S-11 TaxID=3391832 RepID=UPI0039C9D249